MNLRGAFSQTLSRPNFRELAPFDFTDVTGGNTVVGNPDLVGPSSTMSISDGSGSRGVGSSRGQRLL